MGKARVLVADDHTLVAHAFKNLLEPNYEVVGTVSDGRALLRVAHETKPDIVILDLGMPLLNGADAGQELKRVMPHIKILVVTMNEDYELAAYALKHWAAGFLLKKSAGSELAKAIHEILAGKRYVTPKVAQRLLDEFVRDPRPYHAKQLTIRQREVLQLLAEGRTMKEVSGILNVSARTVAFHKYRIMEEFSLKTNSDLIKLAIREHIINPP